MFETGRAFISGANRGIGFELALQLAARGMRVVAGYRDPASSGALLGKVDEVAGLHAKQVDVRCEQELAQLGTWIQAELGGLDLLVNNAGICLQREHSLDELSWQDFTSHLDVNLGGVFKTTRALSPLLKASGGGMIVNVSSRMGSISLAATGNAPYRVSKAALNMLSRLQAEAFAGDGITVLNVTPGWVRTDMGGQAAPTGPQNAVRDLVALMEDFPAVRSGEFVDREGESLPY